MNGAVEDPLKVVRAVIDRRKFALRKRARMNLLLGLMRLELVRGDSVRTYTEYIPTHPVKEGYKPKTR